MSEEYSSGSGGRVASNTSSIISSNPIRRRVAKSAWVFGVGWRGEERKAKAEMEGIGSGGPCLVACGRSGCGGALLTKACAFSSRGMRVAYLTTPNSGMHILQPVFGEPVDPGIWPGDRFGTSCFHAHLLWNKEGEELLRKWRMHILFQYRDPRDILVSRHHKFTEIPWERTIDWMVDWVLPMEPWMRHADTVIRYEDFVLQSSEQMAQLTELFGRQFVDRIRIGEPSPTFRAGRIGDWKTDFPQQYLGLYEVLCAPIRYWEFRHD